MVVRILNNMTFTEYCVLQTLKESFKSLYPGLVKDELRSHARELEMKRVKNESKKMLYDTRIDIWLSSRKKLAAKVLQGALRGLHTRKETPIRFLKEALMNKAKERVESRKAEKEELLDRIKELEEENAILKQHQAQVKELEEENAILKQLHSQATKRHFLAIQMNVEELQHRRQVHHLRKKIDFS